MVEHESLQQFSGYWEPIGKTGYCAQGNSQGKHEYCRCTGVNEIFTCASKCNEDVKCQGYSYDPHSLRCNIYTTAQCTLECYKKNQGKQEK